MVKYRQATQKPSNVCFTGRERMERVKNSHWVSVFAHNSHRGWITPPLFKQSDNLLDSFWRAQSPSREKPLLNGTTTSETGTRKGCISPIASPPFNLRLKVSHEARRRKSSLSSGKQRTQRFSVEVKPSWQKQFPEAQKTRMNGAKCDDAIWLESATFSRATSDDCNRN